MDIKDAPVSVKQAYKMYYKMKTEFLSQSLSEALDDDDEVDFPQAQSANNLSESISELLDPRNSLPEIPRIPEVVAQEQPCDNPREFEAADHLEINDTAWGEKLNRQKPKEKVEEVAKPVFKKKMSLNFEPVVKALRNPKKSLMKFKSSFNFSTNSPQETGEKETLPDLETILAKKSRSNQQLKPDLKTPYTMTSTDTTPSIDIGWLNRNTSMENISFSSEMTEKRPPVAPNLGLANLNMASTSLKGFSRLETTADHPSDSEVVGNSDDEGVPDFSLLPVAKKRRISEETIFDKSAKTEELFNKSAKQELAMEIGEKLMEVEENPTNSEIYWTKNDNLETIEDEQEEELPKKSKKKSKSVARSSRKKTKATEELEPIDETKEEEINFLIDSDLTNFKTIPRASVKELRTTERLFDEFIKNDPHGAEKKAVKVVDAVTEAKKEALMKKVAAGTLNENYKRVNLKKKVFVRGKKAFSFSKFKKGVWKSKKAAALSGPDMDMRGCDGGVLKCFNCGGVGHFAQNCKQKGDNLLPIDAIIEEESAFPTLEEATQMANDKRFSMHGGTSKANEIADDEIWEETDDSSDEVERTNKENHDMNSENVEKAECSSSKEAINVSEMLTKIFWLKFNLWEFYSKSCENFTSICRTSSKFLKLYTIKTKISAQFCRKNSPTKFFG